VTASFRGHAAGRWLKEALVVPTQVAQPAPPTSEAKTFSE